MNPDYFSFLLCAHKDHTDVYVCGREIGVIRDNKFHPTMIMVKDTPVQKTFANMECAGRFKNQGEFKDFLLTVISMIDMEPPKPLTDPKPSV